MPEDQDTPIYESDGGFFMPDGAGRQSRYGKKTFSPTGASEGL